MSDRQKELIERFLHAVAAIPFISERFASGQQFNAYESASNWDDMDGEDREYRIALGPISDHAFLFEIDGSAKAELLESALKLAALLTERTPSSVGEA